MMAKHHPKHLLLPCLIMLLINVGSTLSQCTVNELRVESTNATALFIKWTPDFDCADELLHVHLTRIRIKACTDFKEDGNNNNVRRETRIITLSSSSSSIIVSKLSPFSVYNVEIVGENGRILAGMQAATMSYYPMARPESPKEFSSAKAFTQAIRFVWKNDEDFKSRTCALRNGVPDGFRAELWPRSSWINEHKPLKVVHVPELLNELYVQNLRPFTKYVLRVFLNNQGDLYNNELYLEIEAQTTPAKKMEPPSLIALETVFNEPSISNEEISESASKSTSASLRVQWMPPYPPLGPISGYVVRVGTNESRLASQEGQIVWQRRIAVDADNRCEENNEWPHCILIDHLHYNKVYVAQIQSESAVADASDFSGSFVLRTPELKIDKETDGEDQTKVEHEEEDDKEEEMGKVDKEVSNSTASNMALPRKETTSSPSVWPTFSALLLISALILLPLSLCLIILAYKFKVRQLKLRLQSNQSKSLVDFDTLGSSRSFSFLGSQHTATSSIWSERPSSSFFSATTRSIQSRRLPEIPTNSDAKHQYEHVENDGLREVTDTYGYLKPTFDSGFGSQMGGLEQQTRLVPVRSYCSVHLES